MYPWLSAQLDLKDYRNHPLLTRRETTDPTDRRSRRIRAAVVSSILLFATSAMLTAWFIADYGQASRQPASALPVENEAATPRIENQPAPDTEATIETAYRPDSPVTSLSNERAYPPDDPGTSSALPANLKATLEALRLDGVTVEQINEDDQRVTIVGFAADNVRVAAYMRLLDNEVGKPILNVVQKGQRQDRSVSEFSIELKK